MPTINKNLELFLGLAKIQAIMSRRFDNSLGGISFNEFIILYYLSLATDKKLSRVDLAEKLGLTSSGITRLLLPMEKIGLVKKEAHQSDARMSWILLASGGKEKLSEGLERAEYLVDFVLASTEKKSLGDLNKFLEQLSQAVK
jgi:DNA-binding MarR family transcriptional regulator